MNHPLPVGAEVSLRNWPDHLRKLKWRVNSHRFLPDYSLVSIGTDEESELIAEQADVGPPRSATIKFLKPALPIKN